jgi:23S rRNA (cytosine1962-C5)-methyltransferase
MAPDRQMSLPSVRISERGAARLVRGHPWVYRSDVQDVDSPAGLARVVDPAGRCLGRALWSPASEIRLRLLTADDNDITRTWWTVRIRAALHRREQLDLDSTAYRVVHAEGDGLPALIVDRYGKHVVVQLLSAGLESMRDDLTAAISEVLRPASLLFRNDASVRRHEGLPLQVEEILGPVPDHAEVREGTHRFLVDLRSGQKTGAFLDQRDNRRLAGHVATGRALDLFSYQGWFAIQLAARATEVLAVDSSGAALQQARRNAALNECSSVEWIEGNVFDELRSLDRDRATFDMIVLDPPAFAKRRDALQRAVAGYKELNLRAMRILSPGGRLLTCSCSYHVTQPHFMEMLASAAADSGRHLAIERLLGQSLDHPFVVTVPETGYLKGALVRAVE